ncbi:hypothetical protein HPB50_028391 [Hyalomma asiaticum]|nr:hypothetical protein HPB50_028391 [Hyalomma asiaticum]
MAPLAEPGEVSTGELQQERLDERDEVTRLATVVQELEAKVRGLEEKCSFLEVRNRHLEALDKSRRTTRNAGKVVGAGSSKTDKRRLETDGAVLNAAGDDLRSYGLELSAAFARDRSDRVHKITLDRDVIVVESNLAHVFQGNKARTFSDLIPEDKQIVSDIVALLDDHYVSDAFWKKLSSSLPNLPPLRLLISWREQFDCTTTITRTPGKTRGAQVSFNVELCEALHNVCVKEGVTPDDLSRERVVVKVEGDGCNGLQSAAPMYPCPFCRATDADRTNPALPASHFNQPPLAITRENLRSDCDSKNHSVQYRPLLDIDPGLIIPDVLHMKMRIVNRLLEYVLMEFEDLDDEAPLRNPDATKQEHVDVFVELVRSCGVKFSVCKDETKRSFASLTGSDADRLLHCLPQKLE